MPKPKFVDTNRKIIVFRVPIKKCQPDWSKNGSVMAKKRMPLYGVIGIFRDFSPINWPNNNIFQ